MMPPSRQVAGMVAVVVDASVAAAICAREAQLEPVALSALRHYAGQGCHFYAPGVLTSEVLFVLCRQRSDGRLDSNSFVQATIDLEALLSTILPPPREESALVPIATRICGDCDCRRTADSLYIALAEQLGSTATTVLLTFDRDMRNQAAANAPSVNVDLLVI